MGLLGDIRYMLTQSHYKRTTPYVSVCVCVCMRGCVCCVCRHKHYSMCLINRWKHVGGMFVSVLDNIALHARVCVLIGCHRWVFSLPIRLLIERWSPVTCDKSRNPLVNKVVINSHHKFPQPKMAVPSHAARFVQTKARNIQFTMILRNVFFIL